MCIRDSSGTVTSVTSNSTLSAALTLITDLSTPAVPAITLAVASTHTPSGKFLKDNGTWDTVPAGYDGWTISDGSNTTLVASAATVTFATGNATALSVVESNKTLTYTSNAFSGGANVCLLYTSDAADE